MKAKAKDVLIRAAKTFVQAFLSYLSVDVFFGITDLNAAKKILLSLLLGAVAAGISAVWNTFINWLNSYIEGMHTETVSEDEATTEYEVEYESTGDDDGE